MSKLVALNCATNEHFRTTRPNELEKVHQHFCQHFHLLKWQVIYHLLHFLNYPFFRCSFCSVLYTFDVLRVLFNELLGHVLLFTSDSKWRSVRLLMHLNSRIFVFISFCNITSTTRFKYKYVFTLSSIT